MLKKVEKITKERKLELKALRRAIKKGQYDWNKAVEDTADRVLEHPESLLWR